MRERKKLHRMLSILLCFMLVAGMMPAMSTTVFAANTITTVEASGIRAPHEGESAASKAYKTVTLPLNDGYKLLDVVWYDNASCEDAFTGTFRAGQKYYAEVWLDAAANYQFAGTSGVTVLYEGAAPYFKEVQSSKTRMYFTVEFTCLKNRVTDKESLIYAFNETDYSTIILDDDIMLDPASAIKRINRDITLDLNGHVITAKADGVQYGSVFSIESGGKLTIKDSGNGGGIIFNLEKMPNTYINYLIDVGGGSLLIEGGTFSLTASTQKNGVLIYCEGSSTDVNITGGTFDTTDIYAKNATYCIDVATSYSKKDTINISNAEFNTNDKAIFLSSNFAPEIRNLTIDNCTFNHKDTAIYIGYGTTKISNTTFYSKDSCYAISTKDDAKSPTIADCFAAGQYAYVNGNAYQYGYVNGVPDSITARNLGKKATGTKVEIKSGVPAASVTSVKVGSESEVVARGDTLQCNGIRRWRFQQRCYMGSEWWCFRYHY